MSTLLKAGSPGLPHTRAISALTAVGVFAFFAAMFVVSSGYSYGAGLLLLVSVWFLGGRRGMDLAGEDRLMVAVLLAYFSVTTAMTVWLGNNLTDIDQYSRALLTVPILVLLLCVRVSLPATWAAIVLGIILSVPIAWWQVTVSGDAQAGGFMNEISFSNLTLVFAAFCVGGLFWASSLVRRAAAWRIAFTLGILSGLYSAVVGGSRGSWVAAVSIVALLLIAFWSRKTARGLIGGLFIGLVVLAGFFAWPKSILHARYRAVVANVVQIDKGHTANSIGARVEMYKGAWINLKQHPLMGWNAEEYANALRNLVRAGRVDPIAQQYADNLHNNYLQAWVFTGLPGLLALLALYGVPLWSFGRRLRDSDMTVRVLAFCGSSLVVSFICFSLSYSALRRNYGIMFYVVSFAILWGAMRHAQREGRPQERPDL